LNDRGENGGRGRLLGKDVIVLEKTDRAVVVVGIDHHKRLKQTV